MPIPQATFWFPWASKTAVYTISRASDFVGIVLAGAVIAMCYQLISKDFARSERAGGIFFGVGLGVLACLLECAPDVSGILYILAVLMTTISSLALLFQTRADEIGGNTIKWVFASTTIWAIAIGMYGLVWGYLAASVFAIISIGASVAIVTVLVAAVRGIVLLFKPNQKPEPAT